MRARLYNWGFTLGTASHLALLPALGLPLAGAAQVLACMGGPGGFEASARARAGLLGSSLGRHIGVLT